jgi:peptidoglycan/xylan/chitin deacetylase (PgdA/CDA1 family)
MTTTTTPPMTIAPTGAPVVHPSDGALACTIGQITRDLDAATLGAYERASIERWREERWSSIEQRAGSLAPRDAAQWYEALVFERWRGTHSARGLPPAALKLFYALRRLIPRPIQLAMRRRLVKRQGNPVFPAWPFEAAGAELVNIALADAMLQHGVNMVRFPWFWPGGARAAVTLTHDIESADGLARAPEVAGWEERHDFRSSFNLVSDWYPIDTTVLAQLRSQGHEIGSHAIHHDRSLFASRAAFERQLPLLREAAASLGAVGFRSPATHRVVEWLSELPFSYDCTMPHSDPYEPIPGGTATVWPFMHGEVVELPYTAPQDHTLFNLIGHTDSLLWRQQLESIMARSGMFQVLTHPDAEYLGRPVIARAYRDLLDVIAQRKDVWVALPRDIAAWWRDRAQGLTSPDSGVATWTGADIELAPRS